MISGNIASSTIANQQNMNIRRIEDQIRMEEGRHKTTGLELERKKLALANAQKEFDNTSKSLVESQTKIDKFKKDLDAARQQLSKIWADLKKQNDEKTQEEKNFRKV